MDRLSFNLTTISSPTTVNFVDGMQVIILVWSSTISCVLFCICSMLIRRCVKSNRHSCSRCCCCKHVMLSRPAELTSTSSASPPDQQATSPPEDDSRLGRVNLLPRLVNASIANFNASTDSSSIYFKRVSPPPYDVAVTMPKPDIIIDSQKHSKKDNSNSSVTVHFKVDEGLLSHGAVQDPLVDQSHLLVTTNTSRSSDESQSPRPHNDDSLSNQSAPVESSDLTISNQSHVINDANNFCNVLDLVNIEMRENSAFSMDEELPSYASVIAQSPSSTI